MFPSVFTILHIFRHLAQAELRTTVEEIRKLKTDTRQLLEETEDNSSWPTAVNKPFKTTNRFDVIRWTLVSDNCSYLEYDYINRQPLTGDF